MVKVISIITASVLLFSCTDDSSKDCSSCELLLAEYMKRQALPVDLPETEPVVVEEGDYLISIIVTMDNTYMVDGNTYAFDALTEEIENRMEASENTNSLVKILGDKKADYEAILMLLTYCKTKELKPILSIPD